MMSMETFLDLDKMMTMMEEIPGKKYHHFCE